MSFTAPDAPDAQWYLDRIRYVAEAILPADTPARHEYLPGAEVFLRMLIDDCIAKERGLPVDSWLTNAVDEKARSA